MTFIASSARALVLAGLLGLALSQAGFAAADKRVAEGRKLAEQRCSICHAVGRGGESPLPQAPPFRTLGEKYPVESLDEALAEGITAGHPGMPSTPWEPADIDRFIAYLKSINPAPKATR